MPESSVFAIILAAGESSRFGSTKQLSEYDGTSLVARAVRLAERVCGDRSVLVVGSDWKRVLAACGSQRGFLVRNERYASGMAGSIACGVRSVAHMADAVLIVLADQPLITSEHLNSLLEEWKKATDDIIVSEYLGVQGPPAIFPAHCFDHLMKLEGDQGARALLKDSGYAVKGLKFDAAAVDIDLAEDLQKLQAR